MNEAELRARAEELSQYMDADWSNEDARTILCMLIEINMTYFGGSSS